MKYKLLDKLIIRTPTLPYPERIPYNLEKDKGIDLPPIIREAIFVASPLLYEELQKVTNGEITNPKEIKRIHHSFIRYFSRMSTRCTPFGLFAGCTVGEFGDITNIWINTPLKKTTRLDMYYLCSLTDEILKRNDLREKITYYTNTSLYSLGDRYRYIEYKTKNNTRSYQISEVTSSVYLTNVLLAAKRGSTIDELASLLVSSDITMQEARSYINELIDSQILQNELAQSVTGDDYFNRFIRLLRTLDGVEELLAILTDIQNDLVKLDTKVHDIALYKEIIEKIRSLDISFEEKFLFQVDYCRDTDESSIGIKIAEEVESTVAFLNKITPDYDNTTLAKFRQDFYSRYEDREVPVMEVLDTEIGLGYPSKGKDGDISPLIDDFGVPLLGNQEGASRNNPLHHILLQKTIDCLANKKDEIILTDEDTRGMKENWDNLPPTLGCMFEILQADEKDISIVLSSLGGASGANLLSRFAHTNEKIEGIVKQITDKEQKLLPDVIIAEIVHLPESRIGNILYRPHIREYELLYMANSDLPHDKLIPVSDLMLSIRQGRIVIRSKRLNKEILPRLTNAHNYRNRALPVYHFLCDMQTQNKRNGLYFSWGTLENEFSFRPRVRYKNTVLSEAQWKIKKEEMEKFFGIDEDERLIEEIAGWRENKHLPEKVLLPDGDNGLYVDWNNALSVKSMFAIIKKRNEIIFKEFLFDPEKAVVKGQDGSYVNECIAIFYNTNA